MVKVNVACRLLNLNSSLKKRKKGRVIFNASQRIFSPQPKKTSLDITHSLTSRIFRNQDGIYLFFFKFNSADHFEDDF